MSQSNMNGFVSDEEDEAHSAVFIETSKASDWLRRNLPNEGDKRFFGYCKETEEWILLVNRGGRLWLEVGEAAA